MNVTIWSVGTREINQSVSRWSGTFLEKSGVVVLDEKILSSEDGLIAESGLLRVEGSLEGGNLLRHIDDLNSGKLGLVDGSVSSADGVDDLLVDRPELVPLHKVSVLGRTLSEHELSQSTDSHSLSQHTLQ